jgi:spoIIIJ-associated protein
VEWVVTSARTLEEATEMALDQLGVDEQDAEIEIVQVAQKGLFGRLRAEAQVRARVRPTAPRPTADRRDRRRGGDRDGRGRKGGSGRRDGRRERVPAGVGGSDASGDGDADTQTGSGNGEGSGAGSGEDAGDQRSDSRRGATRSGGPDGSGGGNRRRRNRSSRTAEGAAVSENTQTSTESIPEIDLEAQRAAVETFLTDLVVAFGRDDATVAVTVSEDEALEATVEGTELGLLVGQKGVTLQAVQELVRSMVQRRFVGQPHARVRVDVAGYRARRREALARFAASVAESVKQSGVAKALDPMGSADRKVVHDTVNEIEGVVTLSEGEAEARRVVIRPG